MLLFSLLYGLSQSLKYEGGAVPGGTTRGRQRTGGERVDRESECQEATWSHFVKVPVFVKPHYEQTIEDLIRSS